MDCKLWCLKCDVAICDDCIEMDHDGHPVRNLRKHLLDVIEKKMCSSSYTDLESFVTDLEQRFESCDTQIKRLNSETLDVKEIMKKAESDKSKAQLYLDTFKNRVTKSKPNLAVILELSTIDFRQCAISEQLQFQPLSFTQKETTGVFGCRGIRNQEKQFRYKPGKFETKCWHFRMKIEQRRSLQVGPTYSFYFRNFRIELSAYSQVPATQKDTLCSKHPCLHVNVKFYRCTGANSVVRIKDCKISLLNQKKANKKCRSSNYWFFWLFLAKLFGFA